MWNLWCNVHARKNGLLTLINEAKDMCQIWTSAWFSPIPLVTWRLMRERRVDQLSKRKLQDYLNEPHKMHCHNPNPTPTSPPTKSQCNWKVGRNMVLTKKTPTHPPITRRNSNYLKEGEKKQYLGNKSCQSIWIDSQKNTGSHPNPSKKPKGPKKPQQWQKI